MSRFYDEAYKWELYEKYRSGTALTELCKQTGITDKPLREWFRNFDHKLANLHSMTLVERFRQEAEVETAIEKMEMELRLIKDTFPMESFPELRGQDLNLRPPGYEPLV